jgi:hypothetical protein
VSWRCDRRPAVTATHLLLDQGSRAFVELLRVSQRLWERNLHNVTVVRIVDAGAATRTHGADDFGRLVARFWPFLCQNTREDLCYIVRRIADSIKARSRRQRLGTLEGGNEEARGPESALTRLPVRAS